MDSTYPYNLYIYNDTSPHPHQTEWIACLRIFITNVSRVHNGAEESRDALTLADVTSIYLVFDAEFFTSFLGLFYVNHSVACWEWEVLGLG